MGISSNKDLDDFVRGVGHKLTSNSEGEPRFEAARRAGLDALHANTEALTAWDEVGLILAAAAPFLVEAERIRTINDLERELAHVWNDSQSITYAQLITAFRTVRGETAVLHCARCGNPSSSEGCE